jgi:hypothetical protein
MKQEEKNTLDRLTRPKAPEDKPSTGFLIVQLLCIMSGLLTMQKGNTLWGGIVATLGAAGLLYYLYKKSTKK